jgi:DNA-binding FrmR family transcriptional regulator
MWATYPMGVYSRLGDREHRMEYEFRDERLYLRRSLEEKAPLLNRLNRIEGQVRGLRQMIEEDRYCLDEVQQANAIAAAMRELTLLVISQHLTAGVDFAIKDGDAEAAIKDIMGVLRAALRQG